MSEPCLAITTWPDLYRAREQARSRVEKKLAASLNLLSKIDSRCTWKGEPGSGTEHEILIKTDATRLADLQCEIESARCYAVADFSYIKIDSGEPGYLDWITTSTQ